jgi:hypothetical protein
MAYSFASASSQYLTASSPKTERPITIAVWGQTTGDISGTTLSVCAVSDGVRIQISRANSTGSRIYSFLDNGNATQQSVGATSFADDTWGHGAGFSASATNRAFFVDGSNKATGSTNITASTNYQTIGVGARHNGVSWGGFWSGKIAEIAMWEIDLTDDEIASLAKGFKPTRIRPQSLVFYAPLVRDLQDLKGALTITNNNSATVAVHPRVY